MNESESPADTTLPEPEEARLLAQQARQASEFWSNLVEKATHKVDGVAAVVVARAAEQAEWKALAVWPRDGAARSALAPLRDPALPQQVVDAGGRWAVSLSEDEEATMGFGVMTRLPQSTGVVVLMVARFPVMPAQAEALLDRLQALLAQAPVYHLERLLSQARTDVAQFANVLDLLAVLNARGTFVDACMALTNELTSRLKADRASIGWLKKGYIRVRAISHMEKFEKKMDAVNGLETAMEEAFEQDAEIVWPPIDKDSDVIARDHQRFVEEQTSGHAVSVPIRHEDEPLAVLTLERKASAFTEQELRWLRLCADQVAPRLAWLEGQAVWFGARAWRAVRKKASRWLGVEHTGAKIVAIVLVLALAFLFFGRWPHRVKGDFTLRADVAVVLPAPFDGFLDRAVAEMGDIVDAGEVLAVLDIRDLLIEKASAIADLERYNREAEKARAERDLGTMRMAEAMADQSRARLALLQFRLARAEIRAPFAGAVVEGDHRERAGAPVRQGETLFRLAALDALSVEADVDERDIDFVRVGAPVRLVFASRPNRSFNALVLRVDPMAQTREGANVLLVHCVITDPLEPWWRPGMSGVARIEADRRAPIWLLSRRTLDYLRLRWGW